jgi:hypothetical protein
MIRAGTTTIRRLLRWRLAGEAAFLGGFGLFLGFLGPYGTADDPALPRHVFWLTVIVAGGMLGIAIEARLRPRLPGAWTAALAAVPLMTPPIVLFVLAAMVVLFGHQHDFFGDYAHKLFAEVFVICLVVMVTRRLLWQPAQRIVETRTIHSPPLPDAEATFRRRLSAPRRGARLLAVEAHDHYVRVHTGAGVELLSVRFADAMAELGGAHGFQVHRSWWVSAAAIKAAYWRRASGDIELEGGSGAPLLREAGWI